MGNTSAERSRRWRQNHPERAREFRAAQNAKLLERDPDYYRRWQAEHREECREADRRHYQERRRQVFDHYGWQCACCGSADRISIDHVNGGGQEHRQELNLAGGNARQVYAWLIKNGFPGGFQTLCLPCNQSKGPRSGCQLHAGGDATDDAYQAV